MKEAQIICTVCPIGCTVTVKGNGAEISDISGFQCQRGKRFATDEFVSPVRILTTSIRIHGHSEPLVPVRSSAPIPKGLLMECMEEIKKTEVKTPVLRGEILIKNILGCESDIVATATCK